MVSGDEKFDLLINDETSDGLINDEKSSEEVSQEQQPNTLDSSANELKDIEEKTKTLELSEQCETGTPSVHEKAKALINDEKFLEGSRLLRILNPSELTDDEKSTLELAEQCETLVNFLKKEPALNENEVDKETNEKVWSKSGNDLRSTIVYYRFDSDKGTLDLRVDTTVERSLLLPILAVLNESDLYQSWLPYWSFPRIGATATNKLAEKGKVSQLINIQVDAPRKQRDVMIGAFGFDDIDDNGDLVIKVNGCNTGDVFLGMTVPPPPDPSITRAEFAGGFLFRKDQDPYPKGFEKRADDEDDRVLMNFNFKLNPAIRYIPQWILDFFVGTVVRAVSNQFLYVSREVRDGKREEHTQIMKAKSDMYDWIQARVDKLFDN